jgi:hypothetical protein
MLRWIRSICCGTLHHRKREKGENEYFAETDPYMKEAGDTSRRRPTLLSSGKRLTLLFCKLHFYYFFHSTCVPFTKYLVVWIK